MSKECINTEESLQLIQQIKDQTRTQLIKKNVPYFLLWGYLTIFFSIIHLFTFQTTFGKWMWAAFPLIGYIQAYFTKKILNKKYPGKTLSQRTANTIWAVIGITLIGILFIPNNIVHISNLFAVVILFVGMATCITGFLYNLNAFKISSIIGIVTALVMSYLNLNSLVINESIFAVVFFVMQCLPAHYEIITNRRK
ncbi:hypothetical protein [Falsiporphyromonas endometrii]|uniref:Uncharacterized protein n=1 Tax=Falsiporphyromonas endometrii TaxID=1387297 RepID=A0ABV9KAA4_9PORP